MQMKNVKKLTEKLCVIKNVAPPPKLPLGLCLTAPLKQDERLFLAIKHNLNIKVIVKMPIYIMCS